MPRIGVIGGSGLYRIEGLTVEEKLKIKTPFGEPSGEFTVGTLSGREVVFLPRHGEGHRINPTNINYRANIYGMKKLDVERIISVSACGSLKEEIKPLDFVIPLQFVDRTTQARKCTFFDNGIVGHISFAHPVCGELAGVMYKAAKKEGANAHHGGTYLNMEGPQFSTLAESELYRKWGMDIIGMTNMTEARLAREAEMCYASLAAVTDYDCWHETAETVTVDVIIANLKKNVRKSKEILKSAISSMPEERKCPCKDALKYAIITDPKVIAPAVKKDLSLIIGKYVK